MIDGFDVLEIVPLSEDQIKDICQLTLTDPDGFIEALRAVPYRDLANRPLFLIYLMIIFEDRKRLPERAVDVYRRFMMLALEDWDRGRGLVRRSAYSHFESEAKIDFLALLAYSVTYEAGNKSFSRDKFEEFYQNNCERFDLPRSEAQLVASEIESHTGIIIDVAWQKYEFSHLSIQEYLCAYHIVREPNSKKLGHYLSRNPAPVAVATALSSDANAWLASVLLCSRELGEESLQLLALLDRIVLEKPNFFVSEELGLVAIYVMDSLTRRRIANPDMPLTDILERLLTSNVWQASLAAAIPRYTVDLDALTGRAISIALPTIDSDAPRQFEIKGADYVVLKNRNKYRGPYQITRVPIAILDRRAFKSVVRKFRPKVFGQRENDVPLELSVNLYFPA